MLHSHRELWKAPIASHPSNVLCLQPVESVLERQIWIEWCLDEGWTGVQVRTEELSPHALRSSHTHTQPEWMNRRSSMSRRRETIGRSPSETPWKMTWASERVRMRIPEQVGSCIARRGAAGTSASREGGGGRMEDWIGGRSGFEGYAEWEGRSRAEDARGGGDV